MKCCRFKEELPFLGQNSGPLEQPFIPSLPSLSELTSVTIDKTLLESIDLTEQLASANTKAKNASGEHLESVGKLPRLWYLTLWCTPRMYFKLVMIYDFFCSVKP